jgi:hypothetical protein
MDRLDALKERLKLLTAAPDFREPLAGATLALYNSAGQNVEKLWDRWLQVMEMLDKAQKLTAIAGSPLARKRLAEAEELLNRQGSLQEIEKQVQDCGSGLDQLEQAHAAARAALESVSAARSKLAAQLETIKQLDLSTAPYQDELGSVDTGTTQASAILAADPLGAKAALEQLRSGAERLLSRIERVASLFGDARQVKTTLEAVERQVAGYRAQGLRLAGEGGNPDESLAQGVAAHSETLTALRAGDPEAAAGRLDAARSMVQEAQATVERTQKAKAFCEREQPGRVRETQRLAAALSQAESYQSDLEREYARASWQPVARNLEQARALLASFDRQSQDAAVAASSASQEYVKGARLLEQLAQQQKIVLRLMSGLGEQLNALMSVRTECRKLAEDLAARERQVELYLRQHEAVVGDLAQSSLAEARQARAEVVAQCGEPRADWPALRQRLARVSEELAIAQTQAEADVKSHEELTREFNQARQAASRVYALLAGHEEDRMAANQSYQAAADVLDRIALALSEPRGASARLLEQLRGATADLDHAEKLAQEDLRLAGQAEAMIAEADRSIRRTHDYAAMGVGVDTSGAEAQLDRAQQLLQNQNYEQSIQRAGAAVQAAREAYHFAAHQARQQQLAMEMEERRRAAAMAPPPWNGISIGAAAAVAAAAAILDQISSAASAGPASAPMETPVAPRDSADSGVAVSSWSSDSGQGDW